LPKIVDHDRRREELSDVVLAIIAAKGIKAVTTRNVAAESGWSTGVISHYFRSQHDLLVGALRRAADIQGRMYKRIRSEHAAEPFECLRKLTESVLPFDDRRLAMNRIFQVFYAEAAANPDAREEVVDYLANWRRVLLRVISTAQEAGQIPADLDAEQLAIELVGLADGLAMHATLDPALTRKLTGVELQLLNGSWQLDTLTT
jgi:AcrR family transcriptional regulator